MGQPVEYEIDLGARTQHLVNVTVAVPDDLGAGGRVVLPTWTPGSYVIRDYVHHVQRISARDETGEITLEPDGRSAWRLPDTANGRVRIDLELYANDLSVRTNHVDSHHALLIPPATLPLVEGARDRPHVVHLPTPEGQQVHALLPRGDAPDTWVADDYDHLVDAAFEVGDFPRATWEVAGVEHTLVWAGHGGQPDLGAIAEDAAAICGAAADLFGGEVPADRYAFLCVGWDEGGGGLEHRDGATLMIPVLTFHRTDLSRRLQSLIAHEYLHQWNARRLLPEALVRPDLERPVHSPSLWVAEGWTSFYDAVLPLRAEVWPLDHFLDQMATTAQRVLEAPAAEIQSVREASWQAWVKHYVRDENSVNSSVDYYGHGAMLAWCLDLLIRRESPDSAGLDDALRLLWERFGRTGEGYTEADVAAACAEAAGRDLGDFFDAYVDRPAAPPIEDLIEVVGLATTVPDQSDATPPHLGVQLRDGTDRVTIDAVLRGGPAWGAGITGGDELLAVDGLRVPAGRLDAVLRQYEPGDSIDVALLRGPRLHHVDVTLGEPEPTWELTAVDDPTAAQQAAFQRWTGHTLEDVGGRTG